MSQQNLRCRVIQTLVLVAFVVPALAAQAEDIESIRKRQNKIQKVVKNKMGAVVAVTDGVGFGSGVIVSRDGLVLTAGHVMANGGNNYKVILPSGKELKAKPLGKNLNVDAGMVQIVEKGEYPFVELGTKSEVKKGQWAVCLGHPGGYELGRSAPVRVGKILEVNENDLVSDCALIGGDSGGPLFDLEGKLIAVHSSIGNNIAINRHVTINVFKTHWDRMKAGIQWGTLPDLSQRSKPQKPKGPSGSSKSQPKDDLKRKKRAGLGVTLEPSEVEAKITLIREGSPASRIGLKVGDKITRFEGQQIDSSKQLVDLIKQEENGATVAITIDRNGSQLHYQVILADLKTP